MRIALHAVGDAGQRAGRILLAERDLDALGLYGHSGGRVADRRTMAIRELEGFDVLVTDDVDAASQFAGIALDGSVLQIDQNAAASYYRFAGAGANEVLPVEAAKLMEQVAVYTGKGQAEPTVAGPTVAGPTVAGPTVAVPSVEANTVGRETPFAAPSPTAAISQNLAAAAENLANLLDDNWKRYLALPAEVYQPDADPSIEALAGTIERFDRVARDARYRALTQQDAFTATHGWLREYLRVLEASSDGKLALPPPPGE